MLAIGLAAAGSAFAARNGVAWDAVDLPASGTVGEAINFTAKVTNAGDAQWSVDYFLELRDPTGAHLNYVSVAHTAPRASRTVVFALKLPERAGSYTYELAALQHGGNYFGAPLPRTIVVRPPPLDVNLSVDDATIALGHQTMVRSVAGLRGEVATHGLEARALDGVWQTWAAWSDAGGEEQIAFPQPKEPGVYEFRAYAARDGDADLTFSDPVFVTVVGAPAITTQPISAVGNIGEPIALAVAAAGLELSYQWRKDGVALAGATDRLLQLGPAQPGHSGTYSVIVSNSSGTAVSRPVNVGIAPLILPAIGVDVWSFPAAGGTRAVARNAAQVGDVASISSVANLTADIGWRHNLLVRRPAITLHTALPPADGSGFTSADEAWNFEGWGLPHADGNSYDARVTGGPAADLGNREPFVHPLAAGEANSRRAADLVLDAPGTWLVRAAVVNGTGQVIALSAPVWIEVAAAPLATDPANLSYPYGRTDRFVGVFWNAGQAHRLWSTWRAEFQAAYRATWAVNWKLMWQPSPYFRAHDGGWLRPNPAADSPWQSFWSAHQVYALVPNADERSQLTHDLTSQAFAEKAAVRLMDIGVDFVAVDYTNQFLEDREDVLPAVSNLALAFQAVAQRSQSGQRIQLTAVVPANVNSGDWAGSGGFGPRAIGRFNAKLTTLYNRFARSEAAWFQLEDDTGTRKPLLLLWVGASGEEEPDGSVSRAKLDQLRLADGRRMTDVFTIRWVGAFLPGNQRFLTGATYTVNTSEGVVTGKYANAKFWSYHENFPAAAAILPGASGPAPAVEAVTVQPLAAGRDRFGRAWNVNWPAGENFHYESPAEGTAVPLAAYGRIWRDALAAARALNPKFLLTTWAEFGSENDEPRPELSVTVMDNNKFGTHFGDAFKETVRRFKYVAPTAWVDAYTIGGVTQWFNEVGASTLPPLRPEEALRLEGWVSPNVATTFAGGSVKVYIDDTLRGTAIVGGAWNGATHWYFDLAAGSVSAGRHTFKVVADDGVGGSSVAGVQFRGEPPRNNLPLEVSGGAVGSGT